MADHTHLLISIQPDLSISDLVRVYKSQFIILDKKKFPSLQTFAWQHGFGAFSYSKSRSLQVVNYILNQPLHHKRDI
jgi:REP element-mobilizing transposase RayT